MLRCPTRYVVTHNHHILRAKAINNARFAPMSNSAEQPYKGIKKHASCMYLYPFFCSPLHKEVVKSLQIANFVEKY